MGKIFLIDEELANRLLSYIGSQPFADVYELGDGLLHLKEFRPESGTIVTTPAKKG